MDNTKYSAEMNTIAEFSGGNFILFRLDYCRQLEGDGSTAAVLCYLLNVLQAKDSSPNEKTNLMENDLYFKCPVKRIQTDLGMSKKRQITCFNHLIRKKIISTKRRDGNCTWIKVNVKILDKMTTNDEKVYTSGG